MLRDRVTKHMRLADPEGARAAVDAYLARRDSEASRRFAADVLFRLGSWRDALRLASSDTRLHTSAAISRRVARQALSALAWDDLERKNGNALEPQVVCSLVQGGDAWAESRLRDLARRESFDRLMPFFMATFSGLTPRATEILRQEAARRSDETTRIALAVSGALHASTPMPPKEADVLVETITGEAWRERSPFIWYYAALAFGLTGDERIPEVANAAMAKMPKGDNPALTADRARLLLAKHQRGWIDTEAGRRWRTQSKPDLPSAEWIARYVCRDLLKREEGAASDYRELWREPGRHVELLRLRLAGPFLLSSAQETGLPDENMLRDLDGLSREAQVTAQAWRLRRGDSGARKTLWSWVKAWGSDESSDVTDPAVDGQQGDLMRALQALYLFDPVPRS